MVLRYRMLERLNGLFTTINLHHYAMCWIYVFWVRTKGTVSGLFWMLNVMKNYVRSHRSFVSLLFAETESQIMCACMIPLAVDIWLFYSIIIYDKNKKSNWHIKLQVDFYVWNVYKHVTTGQNIFSWWKS